MTKLKAKRKNDLLITAFPKSGSTYLVNSIASLSNWRRVDLVPRYGNREQELDELSILRNLFSKDMAMQQNTIAQNHTRASRHSLDLICKYDIKVFVLVRNLLDVVCSLLDHFNNESVDGFCWNLTPKNLHDIDNSHDITRAQYVVRFILPWYFDFYLGWQREIFIGNPHVLGLITYEDLYHNVPFREYLEQILGNAKLLHNSNLSQLHTVGKSRFNKGVISRGVQLFKDDQAAYNDLLKLMSFYPHLDFSLIFCNLL